MSKVEAILGWTASHSIEPMTYSSLTPLAETIPKNKKVQFVQPMTMDQIEYNRRLNSTRQVIIKQKREITPNKKRSRPHRPSKIPGTNDLFSMTVSSKSIYSAPTDPLGGTSFMKHSKSQIGP